MPKLSFRNKITPRILIGSSSSFPLEGRIFHGISIGLIILTSIYVPYNLYAGLYVGSISALVACLFYTQQYYYSRFLGKPHNSTLFALMGIVIFGVNYFTNSGISGSTDLIWPVHLLLVLAISPYQQHLRWLIVYLVVFVIIHYIEFEYPHLVMHPFTAGKGQFIDRVTAFPIPVIAIYVIIKFMRRSYDKERLASSEKALAIENTKTQISIQNEQLTQSNIEKNKLMSIISHDLRAPLVNIKSYLELLTTNEIESNERPMLENALLKSTSNALEMLSNLLHWSKSQMSGANLQLSNVNLLDTLLSTLEMEKLFSSKKEIKLTYDISTRINVIADVDMLQLIVRNLIGNAVKFTTQGGCVKVVAEIIDNECKLTIIDNGSGITEAKQNDIFSIQAASSYGTNNEKGVGLGLVLCKEFIELQNGRIGFESIPSIGSSFFIFIPLAPSELQSAN